METLIEKIRIIESSGSQGKVNLGSLTNFPQVFFLPRSSHLSLSSIMALEIVAPICACFVGRGHLMRIISLYSVKIFLNTLTGSVATWLLRLDKASNWREMANTFLEYYQFNTKVAPNRIDLQRIERIIGNLSVSLPRGGERRLLKCTPYD